MKRINLLVPQEQYEQLKRIATDRVSLSEHVRRAIDEYLVRWGKGERRTPKEGK